MAADLGEATGRERRFFVLGASNVTRSITTVINQVIGTRRPPLEIVVAAGHGRSYGMESRVLGRCLPAILECGLWDRLTAAGVDGEALITDIGNDLIYGASPRSIINWVEQCAQRLQPVVRRIVVTGPPTESVVRLSRRGYWMARTSLFPSSKLTFEAALSGCQELDERIRELATRCGLSHVQPRRQWYGVDPVHIRRAARTKPGGKFFQLLEIRFAAARRTARRAWKACD